MRHSINTYIKPRLGAFYPGMPANDTYYPDSDRIACEWQALRSQLLLQWKRVTSRELDQIGPDRHDIALLIQSKYGIAAELVENYLRNFERTMPTIQ